MSTTVRALPLADELRPPSREWTVFLWRLGRRRTALFGAVVVLTMLAAESFDPRLIWDTSEEKP